MKLSALPQSTCLLTQLCNKCDYIKNLFCILYCIYTRLQGSAIIIIIMIIILRVQLLVYCSLRSSYYLEQVLVDRILKYLYSYFTKVCLHDSIPGFLSWDYFYPANSLKYAIYVFYQLPKYKNKLSFIFIYVAIALGISCSSILYKYAASYICTYVIRHMN